MSFIHHDRNNEQMLIPITMIRGGTSRAFYFEGKNVPPQGKGLEEFVVAVPGSPDPMAMDGLGGDTLLQSKVAIVSPSSRSDADVDYTFTQIFPDQPAGLSYKMNCGNISSGVPVFALMKDMIPNVLDGRVTVRVFSTNTGHGATAAGAAAQGRAADRLEPVHPGHHPEGGAPVRRLRHHPRNYTDLNGQTVRAQDVNLVARFYLESIMHTAAPATGSCCLGAAASIPGTVPNRVLATGDLKAGKGGTLTFGHPSGTFSVKAEPVVTASPNDVTFKQAAYPRTARIICDGTVYIKNERPAQFSAWKELDEITAGSFYLEADSVNIQK